MKSKTRLFGNFHGFTMIEVALFLGISSVLTAAALIGIGPRLQSVRFTESINAIAADIQQNLSSLQTGVNTRSNNLVCKDDLPSSSILHVYNAASLGDAAGSSGDCVLNGRLVMLGPTSATYYTIASRRTPTSQSCIDSATAQIDRVYCYKPTIIGSSVVQANTTSYLNGAKFYFIGPGGVYIGIAYFQDPGSEAKYLIPYSYSSSVTTNTAFTGSLSSLTGFGICLQVGSRVGHVRFVTNSLTPEINGLIIPKNCGS